VTIGIGLVPPVVDLALVQRQHQRRIAVSVLRVHIGAPLDERLDDLQEVGFAIGGHDRFVERRAPVFVAMVDVDRGIEQQLLRSLGYAGAANP
jgi:hypothetical protein